MMTLSKALAVVTERGLIDGGRGPATTCSAAREPWAPTRSSGWRPCRTAAACPRRSSGTSTPCRKPDDLPTSATPDAYRIRRLRDLDDIPVAVEEIWLDRAFRRPEAGAYLGIALQDLCREAGPHHHPGGGSGRHRAPARLGARNTASAPAPRWALSNGAASINTATGGGLAQLVRSRPRALRRKGALTGAVWGGRDTCATASSDAA
jgi:hypothetical protein